MNAAARDSASMRVQLAQVGIQLDDKRPSLTAASASARPTVDRPAIRAALIARGAPDRDLEWLTASAPSIECAQAYRPAEVL